MKPGGVLANILRQPANVANTSIILEGERLLALWEGGPPNDLDRNTLDTIGLETFGGGVKAFSAHPKLDPATGELFNFGIDYGARTTLTPYRLAGTRHHVVSPRRSARLTHNMRQFQRAQRRLLRRLVHHRIAPRQRRTQLMQRQIQRHVKRSNNPNHPQRLPYGHRHATRPNRRAVNRHQFYRRQNAL